MAQPNMFVGLTQGKRYALAFIAGFLAVLVFQQPVMHLITTAAGVKVPTYSMTPTAPLGLPQVISSAIWGGIWGVGLMAVRNWLGVGARFWLLSTLVGGLALVVVFWFIAAPLKGLPLASGWQPARMIVGFLVNAAWGLGWAILAVAIARMMGARAVARA